MANVNITTLLDGSRHGIIHVSIDGTLGDLNDEVLFDPLSSKDRISVSEIVHSFSGFHGTLKYVSNDDAAGSPIWVLAEGPDGHVDFNPFGGFKDRYGLDGTGKLVLSTTGMVNEGDAGSMIIKFRKG